MPSSDFNLTYTWKDLLAGAEQLNRSDFEMFFQELLMVRANQRGPSLSEKETELLKKINTGPSAAIRNRANELRSLSKERLLSIAENEEFINLIDRLENQDANRVNWLSELAQIRKISVADLMSQLEIKPAFDA